AGLTAGIRLAQGGLRVTVVATGEGCLPLASGTVDVLGYAPDPVHSPLDALLPRGVAAADLSGGGEVLIAGIRGFPDFYPALIAENLCQAAAAPARAIRARATELDWPGSSGDLVPFRLARRLEDGEIRRSLAAQLRTKIGSAAAVGMPAVLGREQAADVHADLERQLGVPVFEIPGLPPSLP